MPQYAPPFAKLFDLFTYRSIFDKVSSHIVSHAQKLPSEEVLCCKFGNEFDYCNNLAVN
jgi:hypothetical protein